MQCNSIVSRQRSIELSGLPDADDQLLDRLVAIRAAKTHPRPARYDELLSVLQKDFKVGCVIPYYTEYIHDPNGRLEKVMSRFSRSFVQNMVGILQSQLDAGTAPTLTETDDTTTVNDGAITNFQCSGGSGSVNFGVVWGRGTTAEATTQTKLTTPITHGTGANQISFGATAIGSFNPMASSTDITITRSGTSTAGVTVEERGVAVKGESSIIYFLAIRDVAQVVVGAGQTITTVYTLDFAL